MRIYVRYEELDGEYYTKAITKVSLVPFKTSCYYLDIKEGSKKKYSVIEFEGDDNNKIDLHPYNCKVEEWGFYNHKKNIFILDDGDIPEEDIDDYDEYAKVETYKEGVVIKTMYTQDV